MKRCFARLIAAYRAMWQANRSFVIAVALLSVGVVAVTESAFRFSVAGGLRLLYRFPLDVLLAAAVLAGCALLLTYLTNRPRLPTGLVFVLYLGLSSANLGLQFFRSTPITPRDFLLAREVAAIGTELWSSRLMLMIALSVAFAALVLRLIHRFSGRFAAFPLRSGASLRLTIPAFLLIAVVCIASQGTRQAFLIRFLAGSDIPPPPVELTQTFDELLASGEVAPQLSALATPSGQKPNILIIQSEAFWDPMRLGAIFNRDPVPEFRRIRSNTVHGELLVPVFGGGTCNTEYEILTGGSVRAFIGDPWYLIFPNEIDAPIQSAASILRAQGYRAFAHHPFHNWYFNRRAVYRDLGFEEFKSIEYVRDQIKYTEIYVPDSYFTTELVRQLRETDEPVFSFTVTMQNHGPYEYDRFLDDKPDIRVEPRAGLTDDASFFLTNYSQGVALSDAELPLLLDALAALDEPTIVLFYGDHLPMLGLNYLAYREAGYVGDHFEEGSDDMLRIKSVPYFLWSNYDNRSIDLGLHNSYYMLPMLLRYAGLELPENMTALEKTAARFPTFDGVTLTDYKGERYTASTEEQVLYRDFLKNYNSTIFGEADPDAEGQNPPDTRVLVQSAESYNPDYNRDLDIVTISRADRYGITGSHLYHGIVVLVDGEALPTDAVNYESRSSIRFVTPLSSGTHRIRLELRDSNDAVLTRSPEVEVRVP